MEEEAYGVHPGSILFEDKIEGRSWTRTIDEVPESIAWVELDEGVEAVVRIEISGLPERRCISKFAADGRLLETTIQAPPPPRPEEE
jgi:hypothetical protein